MFFVFEKYFFQVYYGELIFVFKHVHYSLYLVIIAYVYNVEKVQV
jgi:hypothetical protein